MLETTRGKKNSKKIFRKRTPKKTDCPYNSGVLRVARGGSRVKAPPLVARPVPWNGRGRGRVELTDGCYSGGDSQWLPGLNKVTPVSLGSTHYQFSIKTLLSKKIKKIPGGGFPFIVFPDQEPGGRGPPTKHLVQILRGGSSSSGFLIKEHSK